METAIGLPELTTSSPASVHSTNEVPLVRSGLSQSGHSTSMKMSKKIAGQSPQVPDEYHWHVSVEYSLRICNFRRTTPDLHVVFSLVEMSGLFCDGLSTD